MQRHPVLTGEIDFSLARFGGIVELLVPVWRHDVAVLGLAEVKLRLGQRGYIDPGGYPRRDIAHEEHRLAFLVDFAYAVQGHAVAVRIGQMQVDPVLRIEGELTGIEFPGGKHHFALPSADGVPIDVNVAEGVIGPQRLELFVGELERPEIPQAQVGQGRTVGTDCLVPFAQGVIVHGETIEPESLPGGVDVAFDIGLFLGEFVGPDHNRLDQAGKHTAQDKGGNQE